MKEIITNADQFGLTRGINKGIIEALEKGVVTTTTLIHSGYDVDYAIDYARQNRTNAGVHLNLTFGRPIASAASSVAAAGNFMTRKELLKACLLNKIEKEDVIREFEAQITYFAEQGVNITHIDTHQHIQTLSPIFEAAAFLAKKYGFWLRLPKETIFFRKLNSAKNLFFLTKKIIISKQCSTLRKKLRKAGVRTPDKFLSPFGFIPRPVEFTKQHFLIMLEHTVDGMNEIMAHPGYIDADFDDFSSWKEQREQELLVYLDPQVKEALAAVRDGG